MNKSAQLPAFNTNPEEDKTIRFLLKQSVAKALSKRAVYDREIYKPRSDSPAERLAAEFVTQYLFSHLMSFTLDSLESETKNHIRKRHDEKYINYKLKLAPGNNLIERLRYPPFSWEANSTTNSTITRSQLSPPPKLQGPYDDPLFQSTTTTGTSSRTTHRRIHVKVKKNEKGQIIEDPKEVVRSDKVLERISKKDQEFLLSTRTGTTTTHAGDTSTKSRSHHHHHHHHHNNSNSIEQESSLPRPAVNLYGYSAVGEDGVETIYKKDRNRPANIRTDFSVRADTKEHRKRTPTRDDKRRTKARDEKQRTIEKEPKQRTIADEGKQKTITNERKSEVPIDSTNRRKERTKTATATQDEHIQTAYYSQRSPGMKYADYPDIKPRLKNIEVEASPTKMAEDYERSSPHSSPMKKDMEFAFIARIRDLMQKEVEEKAQDIDALQDLIREKEEIESNNAKEVKMQPIKQVQPSKPTKMSRVDSNKMLIDVQQLPLDVPVLDEHEKEMLSPKVPPEVIRTSSCSSPYTQKKPERLPAIETESSYYDSYYSD